MSQRLLCVANNLKNLANALSDAQLTRVAQFVLKEANNLKIAASPTHTPENAQAKLSAINAKISTLQGKINSLADEQANRWFWKEGDWQKKLEKTYADCQSLIQTIWNTRDGIAGLEETLSLEPDAEGQRMLDELRIKDQNLMKRLNNLLDTTKFNGDIEQFRNNVTSLSDKLILSFKQQISELEAQRDELVPWIDDFENQIEQTPEYQRMVERENKRINRYPKSPYDYGWEGWQLPKEKQRKYRHLDTDWWPQVKNRTHRKRYTMPRRSV